MGLAHARPNYIHVYHIAVLGNFKITALSIGKKVSSQNYRTEYKIMFTFLFTVLDIRFITTLQMVICVVASLSISNQYSCFIIFTQTCYTCIQNCVKALRTETVHTAKTRLNY